jgi:FixJ family two-component response regulator
MEKVQPVVSIIDDDRSVRQSIARLLASCGLEAETFASAQEYFEAEHSNGVACLILDVYLGGMTGIELYEHLTATGQAPPVIFITAHDDEQTRESIRAQAAVASRKPFDSLSLLEALGKALGRDLGHC